KKTNSRAHAWHRLAIPAPASAGRAIPALSCSLCARRLPSSIGKPPPGRAVVECVDAKGVSQQVGLENMYRRLRREPRENWPDLLADVLGSVNPEAANPPDDLHTVADRLLVRLGAGFSRQEGDIDVWSLPLVADHLMAFLVI